MATHPVNNYKRVYMRESLDLYFGELAEALRKADPTMAPEEIILVGGAAVIAEYRFRGTADGMSVIIQMTPAMEQAIGQVERKFNLPPGWLENDFIYSDGYSERIREVAVPYKTFGDVLHVRAVTGAYLIAVKLRSGRKSRRDLSDVVGILGEHEKRGESISIEDVRNAAAELYGDWESIGTPFRAFVEDVIRAGDYEDRYVTLSVEEQQAGDVLRKFHGTSGVTASKPNRINTLPDHQKTPSIQARFQRRQAQRDIAQELEQEKE